LQLSVAQQMAYVEWVGDGLDEDIRFSRARMVSGVVRRLTRS